MIYFINKTYYLHFHWHNTVSNDSLFVSSNERAKTIPLTLKEKRSRVGIDRFHTSGLPQFQNEACCDVRTRPRFQSEVEVANESR